MRVQSNDFIALSEIAIHDKDLQEAVDSGTRTAYSKRSKSMFAHTHEHGEAMHPISEAHIAEHGLVLGSWRSRQAQQHGVWMRTSTQAAVERPR